MFSAKMKLLTITVFLLAIGVQVVCLFKYNVTAYPKDKFYFYIKRMEEIYNLSGEQVFKILVVIHAWDSEVEILNKKVLKLSRDEIKNKKKQADLHLNDRIEVIVGSQLISSNGSNLGDGN